MNISEFRKDIKKCFDIALSGDTVEIERGGVRYVLVADVNTFRKPKTVSIVPEIKKMQEKAISRPVKEVSPEEATKLADEIVRTFNTCKNGHLTNSYTGRCTQKDCKYA